MRLSDAVAGFDVAMVGEAALATRRWYSQRLSSLVAALGGDVEVGAVTVGDLRSWRAALVARDVRWSGGAGRPACAGGLSGETVRGYVRAVRRLFAWLVEEGVLMESPAARLRLGPRRDQEPKAVAPADILRLLEVADRRDEAIILLLADSGCRVGGLCSLRVGDLDLAHRRALVREKGRGGGKVRPVFFGQRTANALGGLVAGRGPAEPVFLGQRGAALSTGGVYLALKRLALRSGIVGRFNPHSFRHGWARAALQNGADLGTVSQVLGHASVAVTSDFYARWTTEELAERHGRYSPVR